jgi:hypothetical protein
VGTGSLGIGGIISSAVATTAQEGSVFHAAESAFSSAPAVVKGRWETAATAARPAEFPLEGAGERGVELYLAPEAFPAAFAADLPSEVAAVANCVSG